VAQRKAAERKEKQRRKEHRHFVDAAAAVAETEVYEAP
jgi:hypothetical protein